MKNVRMWFKKGGAAKYISHLDLTHCMGRALKLSGLPIWYTQGFNPRIYMAYAMPLSLGVSGERECVDIRLTEEDFPLADVAGRVNLCLPDSISVWGVTEPLNKLDAIAFADYELRLEAGDSAGLKSQIEGLFAQGPVIVMKHGKKGDKELDIAPYFSGMALNAGPGYLEAALRLPCSVSGSINPSLLLDALKGCLGLAPYAEIHRKRLLLEDFSEIA